ncbi:ABC transporter ATP-binding protein [Haloarcula sediminis]|uniref:ABC transporter ATP-binding protein n=1 Tax=Haloarcula sediminis TaxID=3111777 RepID=UPI002D79A1F6|nr:ABC transporter ATP-binding protein [Haloarcula sp. CK38]
MTAVDADGLVKEYETGGETVTALDDVDFALDSGEFVSIMGPSGSGKTTLLNILGLLDTPTAGNLRLDGCSTEGLSDTERTAFRKQTIGFVFQHYYLIPTLTATENVTVPRIFDDGADIRDRAESLLARVDLSDRLSHRPNELSGGQKQRVAIARSLINRPDIVLADEPTGNLDRETGRQILDEFVRVTEDHDVAVLAVTHDELVNEYVDRTVELIDGEVVR